jgi:hypothetical protein
MTRSARPWGRRSISRSPHGLHRSGLSRTPAQAFLAQQRELYIRHDAWRFAPPGSPRYSGKDVVRYFEPEADSDRRSQATAQKAAQAAAEFEGESERERLALQRSLDELRLELAAIKRDLLLRKAFDPNQPRVPSGNRDGGRWTSGEGDDASIVAQAGPSEFQRLSSAPDQAPRGDLAELQEVANDRIVRSRIDEAWNASNPDTTSPREHGFWICRNEITGELFTRPFANPGSAARIVPGPIPGDAVAFFHTHPNRAGLGFVAGPSRGDVDYANTIGLPGLLQSHNGMYYFGPTSRRRER